jgi:hypothetical protein
MVTAYYPGETINLGALPFRESWNSGFVTSLPNVGSADTNRIAAIGNVQQNGGANVVFELTGKGSSVDIFITGDFQGIVATLWVQKEHPELRTTDASGRTLPWVAYFGNVTYSVNKHTDPTNWVAPRAALRILLSAGVNYYLEVGDASSDSTINPDTGQPYGDYADFSILVEDTDFYHSNDQRADAYDVIIPTDNGTYRSAVNNLGFTSAFDDADDPSTVNPKIYNDGWWLYQPTSTGTISITWSVDPKINTIQPACRAFRVQNTTPATFQQIGYSNSPYATDGSGTLAPIVTSTVYAGDQIYIQIGSLDPTQFLGQTLNLAVTGSKSVVQSNTAIPGPDNDHRQNAAVVTITKQSNLVDDQGTVVISEGSYLSDYEDITHATYVPNGTDDPTYDDAFMYQTVWWKYTPTEDGTLTVTAHSSPNTADIHLMVFKQVTSAGGIFKLGGADSPTEWTPGTGQDLVVGTTYYFSIGNRSDTPYSGSVQLDVIGPRTNQSLNPKPPANTTKTTTKDKNTKQPIVDSGSATLLDLVRAFSVQVQQAVRITGTTTIEMVDPDAPLPSGWTADDAPDIYSSAVRTATAENKVLSISAGDVTLTGNANLITDDVRLLRSGWRIPDRLPVYGLPPAAVQRVTYTFSPAGFTASVEHHYAAVPLIAKRTD